MPQVVYTFSYACLPVSIYKWDSGATMHIESLVRYSSFHCGSCRGDIRFLEPLNLHRHRDDRVWNNYIGDDDKAKFLDNNRPMGSSELHLQMLMMTVMMMVIMTMGESEFHSL